MKHSKLAHLSSLRSPPAKNTAWDEDDTDDDDQQSNGYGRKCCRRSCWFSIFIPCLILGLLVAATVVAIILALYLSPSLNTTTTTISSNDQTSVSTAGGSTINTTTAATLNITSFLIANSTSSTLTSSTTSTASVTSMNTTAVTSPTVPTSLTTSTTSTSISTSTSTVPTSLTTSTTSASTSTVPTSLTTSTTSASTSTVPTSLTTSTTSASTSTKTSTSTTSTSSTTTASTFCSNWTWNATAVTVAGTGSSGSALNQLNSPWNIYVDPTTSILYIADSQNHRIVKWLPGASSGTIIAGNGSSGSQANQLNTPRDVSVDSLGNIYVADASNQRIQFFPNGSTIGSTISATWSIGHIYGVFVYNRSIYACDYDYGAVWNNGTAAAGNQGLGSGANQLNQPQGFTVDTSFNKSTMYVANSQQHTIVQWLPGASAGTVVAGTSGTGSNSNTTLHFPVALKIDSYSNLFIVDNNNHRIQLYCRYPSVSSSGQTIAGTTSVAGTSSTLLNYPAGIALDSALNLYVSDTSNHRIQKFMRLS